MKFIYYKTSDPDDYKIIEIKTLKEMLALVKKCGAIVLQKSSGSYEVPECDYEIENYDDYRE